jgi:hypothetical protein
MVKGKGTYRPLSARELKLLKRFYLSALVIAYALITPKSENGGHNAVEKNLSQPPHIASTKEEIRFYLEDLSRGVDRQGELKLLFPDCLPLAAPALLYRLKKSGFSDCRALMTGEGLLLCSRR